MEFKITTLTIEGLILKYQNDILILDPPYQRNFIWSKSDQETLLDSILNNYPLPNLFFLEKNEKYEIVDGQQRIRTIINYYKGLLIPKNKEQKKEEIDIKRFLNYKLIVAIITSLNEGSESIEEFYARVNRTGLKLNKPELNKAEYFYTEYLALNQELANCEQFNQLDIFTDTAVKRMNDIDFISELVAFLHYGLFDKKDKVDELYENDITSERKEELKKQFLEVLDIFVLFNSIHPIKKTRFKQRNDFFTLFGFINNNMDSLSREDFTYIYKLLSIIQEDISPSNDFCFSFREYALHCVSQSNSKNAREKRSDFMNELCLNEENTPNTLQSDIMSYYEIDTYQLNVIGEKPYYILPIKDIQKIKN